MSKVQYWLFSDIPRVKSESWNVILQSESRKDELIKYVKYHVQRKLVTRRLHDIKRRRI